MGEGEPEGSPGGGGTASQTPIPWLELKLYDVVHKTGEPPSPTLTAKVNGSFLPNGRLPTVQSNVAKGLMIQLTVSDGKSLPLMRAPGIQAGRDVS